MRRYRSAGLLLSMITLFAGAQACGGDDSAVPAGGTDAANGDHPTSDGGGGSDAANVDATSTADASQDAAPDAPAVPTFLHRFDKAQGQLPEGLWEIPGPGGARTPIVSLAPLGALARITADGGTESFATLGNAANTYTLGITTDAAGDVYVGVGAAAAGPKPAPGVYKIAKTGGAGAVFSAGASATPPMNFPNGLDFIGADLFVSDSEGVVYKIGPSGAAAAWSQNALYTPDQTACAGVVPLAVGINGIVHDANNVYVVNTNFGRLIRVPINANGSAGAPVVVKEDCSLAGADGLVRDKDGTFLVAVNAQNKIVRVTPAGAVSVLASGAPLDTPASLYIEENPGQRRLIITSAGFFSPADGGAPGVLALPIP